MNIKNALLLIVAILAVSSFLSTSIKPVARAIDVTITLYVISATGGMNVIVRDKDGAVIAGANVSSSSQPTGQPVLSGITGTDGVATFSGVLPGLYTLQASKSGYVSGSTQWNVASGSTSSVGITLQGQSSGDGVIPGFPYEAVVIGILLCTVRMMLSRAKKMTA